MSNEAVGAKSAPASIDHWVDHNRAVVSYRRSSVVLWKRVAEALGELFRPWSSPFYGIQEKEDLVLEAVRHQPEIKMIKSVGTSCSAALVALVHLVPRRERELRDREGVTWDMGLGKGQDALPSGGINLRISAPPCLPEVLDVGKDVRRVGKRTPMCKLLTRA